MKSWFHLIELFSLHLRDINHSHPASATMKFTNLSVAALAATVVSARFVEQHEGDQVALMGHQEAEQLYTIETAPGEVMEVTEDDKWELRRVSLIYLSSITRLAVVAGLTPVGTALVAATRLTNIMRIRNRAGG